MPLEIRYADVGNSSDGSVCGATVTNLPFISSMSADETSSKCTYDSPAQHQGEYRATDTSFTSRPAGHGPLPITCEKASPRRASIACCFTK